MHKTWLDVPHYKQEFNYSCLPACVRMVLERHGLALPEADLRQLLGTNDEGTKPRNLFRLTSLGFEVEVKPADLMQLRDALVAGQPPLVLVNTAPLSYWQTTCPHVAVVVGIDDASIWLNDPYFDSAPQQESLTNFLAAWAAYAQNAAFIRPKP